MKNFEKFEFKKGAKGFLSMAGAYGYWYPDINEPIIVNADIIVKHLASWKNQDPYFAFQVPAKYLPLQIDLKDDQLVCVWFHEKIMIFQKMLIN